MSAKRVAIYARVSTDKQTTENQLRELAETAGRRGWEVVARYEDAGISGAKGRDQRPGLDQMLKDASRRKFDVIMVWAIDRLGRSLIGLIKTIKHLEACKVDLFVDRENLDTTSPMGELLFTITGAFAQFERRVIAQRVAAGVRRARAQNVKFGRPRTPKEAAIKKALSRGNMGMLKIARTLGVGSSTVQRIKREMAEAQP